MDTPAPLTLSLVMIVKNEAHNLPKCLESVQGMVDEMIVVDTGSTDGTPDVARRFGAKVFQHAWQDDFAEARNAGLARAGGDWILHLDADEALEPGSRPRLRAVLAAAQCEGLNVCVRNFNPPGSVAAYLDSQQVRLFRNRPAHRYELPIHELIAPSIWEHGGSVAASDLMIWHYGYLVNHVQGETDRAQRNLIMLEQAVAQSPLDAGPCARLGFGYYQLGRSALAYAYLRRTLVELDCSRMTPEFLERVLCTLWDVASIQQDFRLAQHCAKALLALSGGAPLSLNATHTLARSRLQDGERELAVALNEAQALPEALARLETAQQSLQQAGELYTQLRQFAQLSPAGVELAENGRSQSEASLATATGCLALARRQQAAETVVTRWLAADDPVEAMGREPELVDPDVVALVRAKAKAARARANCTDAARLEALSRQLEAAWHCATGPEGQAP